MYMGIFLLQGRVSLHPRTRHVHTHCQPARNAIRESVHIASRRDKVPKRRKLKTSATGNDSKVAVTWIEGNISLCS